MNCLLFIVGEGFIKTLPDIGDSNEVSLTINPLHALLLSEADARRWIECLSQSHGCTVCIFRVIASRDGRFSLTESTPENAFTQVTVDNPNYSNRVKRGI